MKKKTTKQVRGIDRIIKFQLDDGIESLTISGKEALADVSIDNKSNVTLYLYGDEDKLNEVQSQVPFVTIKTAKTGREPDKTKKVTLSQDLTKLALEIAENSKDLADFIKTETTIDLDLSGLIQRLAEIATKLEGLEEKNKGQDERLTAIEEKNESQDDRLSEINVTQEAQASKLKELEDRLNLTGIKPFYVLNEELQVVLFDLGHHCLLKFIQKGNGYGNKAIISGSSYTGGGSNYLNTLTKGLSLPFRVVRNSINIPLLNNNGYPLLVLDIIGNRVSVSQYSTHSDGGAIVGSEILLEKIPENPGV